MVAKVVQAFLICVERISASVRSSASSMAGWPLVRLPNTSGTSSPWQAPRMPPIPPLAR